MKPEDSISYTERCFRGEPASCSYACPFHMDIRAFLDKASKGRWVPAYKILRNATIFPVIVSALCDQPCRECCQRTLLGDEAVALRDLEVACLRYADRQEPESYVIPPKDKHVVVIGAGLAGLSAALSLGQKRFRVTVFEKEDGWGGKLRSHPRFAEFDVDISLQFSAVDVEFRFGREIKTLDELPDADVIYVATGAGGDSFGLLDGWDSTLQTTLDPRVFMGGELCGATPMEAIAQGPEVSKTIEAFLQTGRPARPSGNYDKAKCERYVTHDGAVSAPLVKASDPDGYTEDEARAEAARCLQCDCDTCIAACEMLKRFRKDPRRIAAEVYADMGANPPLSTRKVTREAYSCNICGYCKSVCPEDVDMGAVLQSSRAARMSAGIHPAALHDFWLREMDFATSEGHFASSPKGKDTCEYAFYPGCQLGAFNPDHVLKSYDFLARTHDAGIILGCCGAPAYWAGDEVRLRENAEETRRQWSEMGKPTLVFACATCESLFALFMPEIARVSLYELLALADTNELLGDADELPAGADKGASSALPFDRATVFDPCQARNDDKMQSGVRALAKRAGITLEELAERNRCCGHGGHIRIANPDLYEEITRNRAEASGKPYIVYCANCKEVFVSRSKECAHILDVVFGLSAAAYLPGLDERRKNSLGVKRELMKQIRDVDFRPEPHPWDDLNLVIEDELRKDLDAKLISTSDLKEAIWLAETSNDKLYDESDGMCVCSMVKPVITYWVHYREIAPRTYEVFTAYYHRMRFDREE